MDDGAVSQTPHPFSFCNGFVGYLTAPRIRPSRQLFDPGSSATESLIHGPSVEMYHSIKHKKRSHSDKHNQRHLDSRLTIYLGNQIGSRHVDGHSCSHR